MGCQAAPNVHLYPSHGLGPLWLFLLVTEQIAWLPGSGPAHPPTTTLPFICDTRDIIQPESFQKPLNIQLF